MKKGLEDFEMVTIARMCDTVGQPDYFSEDLFFKYDIADASGRFRYPIRLDGFVVGLVAHGSVTVEVDLDVCRLGPCSLIVIPPERLLQISSVSGDIQGRLLIFSRNLLSTLRVDLHKAVPVLMQFKPCLSLDESEFAVVERFYDLMLEVARSDNRYYKSEILCGIVAASFYELCALVSRRKPMVPVKHTRAEDYFERFVTLLGAKHREQHSLSAYARELNITPKYLSSVVKSVSGKTASEWIDDFVILEAKTMLKYSGMNVQQIAYALNFSSQSFFGKYFRQHTGLSPRQYKMQD